MITPSCTPSKSGASTRQQKNTIQLSFITSTPQIILSPITETTSCKVVLLIADGQVPGETSSLRYAAYRTLLPVPARRHIPLVTVGGDHRNHDDKHDY